MSTIDLQSSLPGNIYTIQQTLSDHIGSTTALAWSPDGQRLAATSLDGSIYLWDGKTGTLLHQRSGLKTPIWDIVWSPDSQRIATSRLDGPIHLWDAKSGALLQILLNRTSLAWSMVWSPDNHYLALGSLDQTVYIWDTQRGNIQHTLIGHTEPVTTVSWSSDGHYLASGSLDRKVCLWDSQTGKSAGEFLQPEPVKKLSWVRNKYVLTCTSISNSITQWYVDTDDDARLLFSLADDLKPGISCKSQDGRIVAIEDTSDHTIILLDLEKDSRTILEGQPGQGKLFSFSADSQCLASCVTSGSQLLQDAIYIWRKNIDVWILESIVKNIPDKAVIAFHPNMEAIAIADKAFGTISLLRRDEAAYSIDAILADAVSYKNAKVVLVGNTGVGKTGLALVLAGEPYTATDSSHGRHVWMFSEEKLYRATQCVEIQEVFLWDLAGQPGYRVIHQLHLDAVTIALVVFDARSEDDPFAGIVYWVRALKQAQGILAPTALMPGIKKFLIEARVDRGGVPASSERINSIKKEYDFIAHFNTSARDNKNIAELSTAIKEAIDWDGLPGVSSTRLFQTIKTFLIEQKQAGFLLENIDNLYLSFLKTKEALSRKEELRQHFEKCIDRLEAVGLIKKLSFGNYILLQPEILDAYASALINAVREEPDGYGIITEDRVRLGDFFMSKDERLKDTGQEKLLLIALIEDLLHRELVLREEPFLVFPAQSTREYSELPEPGRKTVVFTFDGPILNIYIMLAVRLANSGIFIRNKLWKNAVTYMASGGGECGILLHLTDEGHGELTLFFDKAANEQTRTSFEMYIHNHLKRKLSERLKRRPIFICDNCTQELPDDIVQKRLARGFGWLPCPVCEEKVSLRDKEKQAALSSPTIQSMNHTADRQRNLETIKSSLEGKRASNSFDVFLWSSYEDKPAIKKYRNQLQEQGILPWVDDWELQPGCVKQEGIEKSLKLAKSAAVFFGKGGTKSWVRLLEQAFVHEFVEHGRPLIPIILPEATELTVPDLPSIFQGMRWIDFRQQEPDPFALLIWGITNKRPDF